MLQQNDDFHFSPNPTEAISTTAINDPAFNLIYNYLRDPLPTSSPFDRVDDDLFDDYLTSETVNPIYTTPISSESQFQSQEPFDHQSTSPLNPINIKTHPREKFRPRTEKESQESSHYIRTEDKIQPNYPSIEIKPSWIEQKTIIEVTLVDKTRQPHPYTIDNKDCKTSHLIFKRNEPNSLYFHVTEEDFKKREKIFLIEYIKPKQDNDITKDLIKTRRLDQSMLRFTRFYERSDGSYQRDESTTAYSSLMTEDYGHFTVEDIFPLYGPMFGNQKVCIEFKGHLPKDLPTDFLIILTEDRTNWFHPISNFRKRGTNVTFQMPPFPFPSIIRAKINIDIQYKQDSIARVNYIYTSKLDEQLTSPSNSSEADPVYSSTEDRSTKRARQ